MREIKFRAWDRTNKEMYLFRFAHCDGNGLFSAYEDYPTLDYSGIDIMQFTGLKDKNGKDIYEGDIINVCGIYCKVVCNEGAFYYEDLLRVWVKAIHQCTGGTNPKACEVIGNIYENPDLLEEKK